MPGHTFEAAEKFILSREFFGMKLGLENIAGYLESIKTPQKDYHTIHISGTNGKGSTASMLASILQTQGYKTGLFTSPHLISLRERVKVDGREISKRSVASFVDRNRKILSKRKLSFFEVITAMALDHFSRSKVDIAVIETGLGGRLDATNVLNPLLTITTEISRDHLEILGSRLKKIAWEKAGIIKPGVPHLIGMLNDSATSVFKDKCHQKKSRLHKLSSRVFKIKKSDISLDYKEKDFAIKKLSPSLQGIHQLNNAALAIKAARILNNGPIKITKNSIVKGITNTNWAGRFQIVTYKTKPDLILDVSHNISGVEAFVETFQLKYPGKKAYIITGFVKRKEHQKMFKALSKIAENYSLVPLNTKRSSDLDELISGINFRNITYKKFGSLKTAYLKLLKNCFSDDIIIVIGSHYLVGEFIEKFKIK